MKRKLIYLGMTLLFLAGIYIGMKQILAQLEAYSAGTETYAELAVYVQTPTGKKHPQTEETEQTEQAYQPTQDPHPEIDWPVVDWEGLREVNPDVVGWIYLEGTVINYPIVQGSDNSYYLNHLFNGKVNGSGAIFLDCRVPADLSGPNSILYGHHMKNGSMFYGLEQYKKQAYYEDHPYVLVMTPQGNYKLEIFSAYVANVAEDAWETEFDSEEAFSQWLDRSISRSCLKTDIQPTTRDRVMTLSTCSYEFNNARFVVLGVLR